MDRNHCPWHSDNPKSHLGNKRLHSTPPARGARPDRPATGADHGTETGYEVGGTDCAERSAHDVLFQLRWWI